MTREQNSIRKRAKEVAKSIKADKSMKKSIRDAEAAKVLAGAEKDIQNLEIRRTGHTAPDNLDCAVCERKITTGDYVPIGFKDGKMIGRHKKCSPGSANWMKSRIGQTASTRKYYQKGEGINGNDQTSSQEI